MQLLTSEKRAAGSTVDCPRVRSPKPAAPGLLRLNAGAGVRIENGRWMTSKQSEEHLWRGRRDLRRMNAGSFILPERGRSTVFIPPRSLDFGVASRRRIACGEGPVKRISGNQCAQCGAVLIAPEWSEHFPDNRIRNVWSCEACGYEFEDTVYWSARELVDAV